jgi:predicted metal-binding protein
MPKSTLFVCQSCHSNPDRPKDQPTDGTLLLNQLKTSASNPLQSEHLNIQAVGCLWTCGQPCSAAFSAPDKPTYLFTNLLPDTAATALLQFSQLYCDSNTGDIPWKQFPEALQSASIAKIPAVERSRLGSWI